MPLIEAKDIVVRFYIRRGLRRISFNAVDDVDLEIEQGTIVGLLGESGSGKTTLGKVTLDLIKPTKGIVKFMGRDIRKMNKEEYMRYRINAQYIPQDPYASLHPFKKVRDALQEIVKYHRLAKNDKEAIEIILDIMSKVGLNPPEKYLDKYPFQLSGGERQRVSIARALISKPRYIVADEPVTMLDASLKGAIVNTIKNAVSTMGTSLLFITHEITLLQYFGPQTNVLVMYLGKVVEQAPLKELLHNPLHPYTQALISAIPVADPKARATRKLILRGTPPSPLNKPPGCVLSDRCPFATEKCRKEQPILKTISPNHLIACYLY
jgi:oligopeptide/dipeptide ABC transporter ATP-binding protein